METTIKKQIAELNRKNCVKTAKAWWNGLTPTQKAIAVACVVALASAPIWWHLIFKSYSTIKVTMVAKSASGNAAAFIAQKVPASMAFKIFGCAAYAATTGVLAGVIAKNHYSYKQAAADAELLLAD